MKIFSTRYDKTTGWADELPLLDSPQTLLLVFGASSYINFTEPFEQLKQRYPQSVIAGCSTAGEIIGDEVIDESLVLSISCFEHTPIQQVTLPIESKKDSFQVGEQIARTLNREKLAGILVFADGLQINGTPLVNGINAGLSHQVVVTGGLAGDGNAFVRTWVLVDGIPKTQYVSGIGLYGDAVTIRHGSKGGWKPFGRNRLVTKSSENVLYELDGEPALALYKNYLGDMAAGLPATGLRYPLSVSDKKEGKHLIRTILSVNEDDQSLTFTGDIQQGHYARLMFATLDNLVDAAELAAQMANSENDISAEKEVLTIVVSCVGRRFLMDEDPGAELEATLDFLPENTSQIGFYSYGELSPYIKNGSCDLHNQTMTLTTIHE
jgi:hypothetical protein